MDADARHAFGAHFTSEFDIRKVVGPTIVGPWRARIAAAGTSVAKLKAVLRDIRLFRVLDPACGSGNFLYVAYRELRRLEREILLLLAENSAGEPLEAAVSIHQFHGIDIQPFAVELAKVTLMLAKEQEVREAAKLAGPDSLLALETRSPSTTSTKISSAQTPSSPNGRRPMLSSEIRLISAPAMSPRNSATTMPAACRNASPTFRKWPTSARTGSGCHMMRCRRMAAPGSLERIPSGKMRAARPAWIMW
jgi:hypothetical protein